MPLPTLAKSSYDQPSIIRYEMDYDVTEQLTIAEENIRGLNPDQNGIFECIMEAINDPLVAQRAFLLMDPEVLEKPYCTTLLAKVRSQGQIALAMASSGTVVVN